MRKACTPSANCFSTLAVDDAMLNAQLYWRMCCRNCRLSLPLPLSRVHNGSGGCCSGGSMTAPLRQHMFFDSPLNSSAWQCVQRGCNSPALWSWRSTAHHCLCTWPLEGLQKRYRWDCALLTGLKEKHRRGSKKVTVGIEHG